MASQSAASISIKASNPRPNRSRQWKTRPGAVKVRRAAQPASRAEDRDHMAVKLLSLVKRVAFEMREHLPAHVEVDDLVGAGAMGLLDAVRKFDARKHVKIETYARYRIRGAILDGLRSFDTASRDMRRKNKKAESVYRYLEVKLGRAANDAEMAEAMGISLKKWYRTVQELQSMGVDWLRPMQAAEMKLPDEDSIVAENQEDPFDLCYRREQRDALNQALARVSERERVVVTLYYQQDLTMKQIGEQLGIDESRVSQIHSAALAHLRHKVEGLQRSPRPSASATPSVTA